MIGYIAGKILECADGKCIVLSGSADPEFAIGYTLNIPQYGNYTAYHSGMMVQFFVHSHVREDAFDLYGFSSRPEKELFLALLSVTGIGPKGALGILSKVSMSTLIDAILQDDKEALTQVPGIGKKTAERVILELADPIRKKIDQGVFGAADAASSSKKSAKSGANSSSGATSAVSLASRGLIEAKQALLGLGYRDHEISNALKKVAEDARERGENQEFKPEEAIKRALQQLL